MDIVRAAKSADFASGGLARSVRPMRNFARIHARPVGLLALCLWLLACEGEPRRGGAGQTCASADDCREGLACVAAVCVSEADGGATASGAITSTDDAGGGLQSEGACRARRDCTEGLACLDNRCAAASVGMQGPSEVRYGGRGESCQAKNDCAPELMCVMNVCRDVDVRLSRTPKACYRVECATKDDCCKNFVANPNCETYRQNCETDPIFCNTYRSLCECTQDCMDELCVIAAPGCATDAECTSTQTPYCVEGKCRQCNDDSVCSGTGTQCVEGTCLAACTHDENCPALNRCEEGACVRSGCQTDRECAFLTKDALAVCREGKCLVPCQSDADCKTQDPASELSFSVCEAGECVFVGCESDAECRALLDLQSQPGNVRAVCREPAPDDAASDD